MLLGLVGNHHFGRGPHPTEGFTFPNSEKQLSVKKAHEATSRPDRYHPKTSPGRRPLGGQLLHLPGVLCCGSGPRVLDGLKGSQKETVAPCWGSNLKKEPPLNGFVLWD